MTYDRFDHHITQRYGVVIKNWPLKNFCNPSSVGSRVKLEILYNGWQSGATRFEKLTEGEMTSRDNQRFASHLATMSVVPPAPAHEPGRSPPPLLTSSTQPTPSNPDPPPPLVSPTRLVNSDPPPPPTPSTLQPSNPAPPPPPMSSPSQATASNFDSPQFSTTGGRATHVPITSNTPNPLGQTLDLNSISNMIRLDPSLRNIDPTLLAASAPQQCQTFAMSVQTTGSTVPTNPPASLPTPASHLKRNREAFQVITLQSYGTSTKRPRGERRGKRSKQVPPVQGSENIPSGNTASS